MDLEKQKSTKPPYGAQKILVFLLCKNYHRLSQCKVFSDKSSEERIEIIIGQECYLKCLSKGYISTDCTSKKKCAVNNYNQSHYSFLHDALGIALPRNSEIETEKKSHVATFQITLPLNLGTVSIEGDQSNNVLKIVLITIEAEGKTLDTYGFVDPGSQAF